MNRSNLTSMSPVKFCLALAASFLLSVQSASATTVRVITSLGDFSIELFDDVTPVTVTNFLNYVNSGRFNGTLIHRSVSGFIIQGGSFSFNATNNSLDSVTTDSPIQNEFGVSNTRGTVAMAKIGGDPNSASSGWFVNLADNSGSPASLDTQNGGFTVFGRVIGDGMTVVDSIAALPRFTVSDLTDFPLINFVSSPLVTDNFVNIAILVEEEPTPAPNYFDEASGLLRVTVDAGTSGLASMAFSITATDPSVVVQLDLSSVEVLTETVDKIATFDAATGRLVLPELVISGAAAFRNLSFILSDAEQLLFTLESFEAI
ncbi:MAG: peptidylprolyl isomerase [SAR86 cluster bacterium]|uniref:peptidylprolyl isomerase n=1 Tax=SAR86 cluster bacterium TaxID=2030880 RepID=A0A2A4XC59_9GAMM|nr:MAG: peptidylprolyl isomerase [SAR86 cluster bacterium]